MKVLGLTDRYSLDLQTERPRSVVFFFLDAIAISVCSISGTSSNPNREAFGTTYFKSSNHFVDKTALPARKKGSL